MIKRKSNERISQTAINNGDFVIDVGQFFGNPNIPMITADELVQRRGLRENTRDLFPVYDAKNGQSIGNMTAEAFLRKIL
jgi:hypothetical protein